MSRARTQGELALVYTLLLGIEWNLGDAIGARAGVASLLGVSVAGIVAASWWRIGVTPSSLGLAPRQWRRGWPLALGVSLAGAGILAAIGMAVGSASLEAARFAWLEDYALGILGQQVLLQGFFAPGIDRLAADLPRRRRDTAVVGAAAFAFTGLHAPNPALMVGVLCAGVFWLWHFRRHHNLPAVLASHFILGVAAMTSLGPGPLLNLRVGASALALLGR